LQLNWRTHEYFNSDLLSLHNEVRHNSLVVTTADSSTCHTELLTSTSALGRKYLYTLLYLNISHILCNKQPKVYKGSRKQLYSFLTSVLDRGQWSTTHSDRFAQGKGIPELGGFQSGLACFGRRNVSCWKSNPGPFTR